MPKNIELTDEEANELSRILDVLIDMPNANHPHLWLVRGRTVDADTAGIDLQGFSLHEDLVFVSSEDGKSFNAIERIFKKLNPDD